MKKTLARSSTDRKISGVCGGIAEYLNIDSTIIRVAFILLIFGGGFGLLLYIIAAIIMPMDYEVGRNHTNYQTQNTSYSDNTTQSSNEDTATNDSNSEVKNESDINLSNQEQKKSILNPATIIGAILVAIGIIFMVNIFFPSFDFGVVIALCIVAAGVLIIVKGGK
jgi:phage shock protein C